MGLFVSCHVLSCLVLSCLVLSCLVLSCHVLSCHVLSCLVLSCHVLSCHVLSCHSPSARLSLLSGPGEFAPGRHPGEPLERRDPRNNQKYKNGIKIIAFQRIQADQQTYKDRHMYFDHSMCSACVYISAHKAAYKASAIQRAGGHSTNVEL